ncbi:MAG: diaminopimelate epimerase [Candidatus Omnitrophica bacterium]|nr:diaminopimelate epimerase [Candidatus Omnitrophota bacterium]
MEKINFTKIVASGNDFVIIKSLSANNHRLSNLARKICDRKFGIGADGLLLLGHSKKAEIKMRIFNADGSEAKMCGNGARCAALYTRKRNAKIDTMAGIIESAVDGNSVRIKLTKPRNLRLDMPLEINNRILHINFIDTGVPHTVIFVVDLDKIDVFNIGRKIRYHKRFAPYGTNVDFVEILNNNLIKMRTYERGVEDETLACGTGAVAAALITSQKLKVKNQRDMNVKTKSGEVLKVYFYKKENNFENIWLEGKVKIVYKGEYYV